jgi:hypothetical protein
LTRPDKYFNFAIMSDKLKIAIEELQSQIAAKEAKIHPLRIAANHLCKVLGIEELYPVGDSEAQRMKSVLLFRRDEFFNRPLSTCVAEYLSKRKEAGLEGPASTDEIHVSLVQGGYRFEGTSGNDENTKRALKTALTKNSAMFVKITDDVFGLRKWYGMRSGRKSQNGNGDQALPPEGEEPIGELSSQTEIALSETLSGSENEKPSNS